MPVGFHVAQLIRLQGPSWKVPCPTKRPSIGYRPVGSPGGLLVPALDVNGVDQKCVRML